MPLAAGAARTGVRASHAVLLWQVSPDPATLPDRRSPSAPRDRTFVKPIVHAGGPGSRSVPGSRQRREAFIRRGATIKGDILRTPPAASPARIRIWAIHHPKP